VTRHTAYNADPGKRHWRNIEIDRTRMYGVDLFNPEKWFWGAHFLFFFTLDFLFFNGPLEMSSLIALIRSGKFARGE
jgi:hypothetical protein